MVSFWNQKKDDPDRPGSSRARDEGHDGNAPASDHAEPTERSRLLPQNNDQGYLSPDDPAVSDADLVTIFLSYLYRPGLPIQSMERTSAPRTFSSCAGC